MASRRSKTGVWYVTVVATSENPDGGYWRVADAAGNITLPKTLTYKQALKALLKRLRTEP